MKKINFEWYVMNENRRTHEIGPFNIFCNHRVNEDTNALCAKYKKTKEGAFEEFVEALRLLIMSEEWSRTEYEICVANWPPVYKDKDGNRICVYTGQEHKPIDDVDMWKIDCYAQVLPNIRLLAKYVLEEYYPRLKITLTSQ